MATRKRKKKQTAPLKLRDLSCHMADFRVVRLDCERFLRPEDSPEGRLEFESSSSLDLVKPANKKQYVVLRSTIEMKGTAGLSKAGKPSFRVLLVSEGLFIHSAGELTMKSEFDEEVMRQLLSEVYPVAMFKIRQVATDMGYTGVRPTLGFDRESELNDEPPKDKVVTERPAATTA